MNFLKRKIVSCVAVNGGTESSQIQSKISSFVFLRLTKVMGIKVIMIEFKFWGELTL